MRRTRDTDSKDPLPGGARGGFYFRARSWEQGAWKHIAQGTEHRAQCIVHTEEKLMARGRDKVPLPGGARGGYSKDKRQS
jgi:hypothetical protein